MILACDENNRNRYLKTLILLLPEENQIILKTLFLFMNKIIQHSSFNKMAIHNIATVFAPNLLRNIPTEGKKKNLYIKIKIFESNGRGYSYN